MYSGFGLTGVMPFATPEKGSGCREQTRRVSTETERSKAQNNWAPKSRDPWRVLACFRKSSLEVMVSASRRIVSYGNKLISGEQHRIVRLGSIPLDPSLPWDLLPNALAATPAPLP